jgi:hypothetical protein
MLITLAPIVPKKQWTAEDFEKVADAALHKTAKLVQQDLTATTRTWKTRVEFRIYQVRFRQALTVEIKTDNKIWGYVSFGTKPHVIRARTKPLLKFRTGFIPKTRVGIIGSWPGGYGVHSQWVSVKEVHHPGTRARNFHKVIVSRRTVTLRQEVAQGFAKLARKRG